MEFFDLMSISHRYMEILNPSTPEKIIKLGKLLKLKKGSRVIDFGCGCAEPLTLWAEEFGITGTGIDISEDFCDRARKKLTTKELSDRIEIVCSPAAYPGEISRLFGLKKAGCSGKSATLLVALD